jgi:FKBP-type peptidyl-prolyl cis-trans isomerase
MKRLTIVSILLFGFVLLAGCGGGDSGSADTRQPSEPESAAEEPSGAEVEEAPQQEPLNTYVMDNGLEVQILAEGEGPGIENGQTAFMHYDGWFYDESAPMNRGEKFDSSRDRGAPLPFPLGAGRVIQGWDQGVLGMKVGERRVLTIPSELAYGEQGHPAGIPPNAKLLFDVELVDIQ